MNKTLIIGAALAASMLTACGGGTDGAATTSSTTSSSSSSASSSSSSAPSSTATSEESVAEDTTEDTTTGAGATGEPVVLDEQSTTWFSTFCGAFNDIQASSESMNSMKPDPAAPPADTQAALTAGVTDFGNVFKTAATDLSSVPPATIEGGQELATGASSAFGQIGDTLIAAADKFAATPVTDTASLQAAATTLATEIQGSVSGLQTAVAPFDDILTPELGVAVEKIPGCEGIASS